MDKRRYFGLDALRGVMMMLGIVLHGAMFYFKIPILEVSLDPSTSPLFLLIFAFIHSFRMPLFFVLAGFFASLLVEKYEIRGALINRAKRVLGPLLLGLITVLPLTLVFVVSYAASARFGEWQFLATWEQIQIIGAEATEQLQIISAKLGVSVPDVNEPSPMHLWFLYYLLYFYLTIPVCRFMVNWLNRSNWNPRIRICVESRLLLPALGLLTGITLLPYPAGQVIGGFVLFRPHVPSLIFYGSFFFFGYFIHTFREILRAFERHVGRYAIAALVLFPAAMAASAFDILSDEPSIWLHLAAALLNGLSTWSLIYLFFGLFLRYFDFESPWILYISQSSYWVYLLHAPVVFMMGWLLLPLELSAYVKFTIAVVTTTGLCFLSYHYMVRKTWIGVLLHGRRFVLGWPWMGHSKLK